METVRKHLTGIKLLRLISMKGEEGYADAVATGVTREKIKVVEILESRARDSWTHTRNEGWQTNVKNSPKTAVKD